MAKPPPPLADYMQITRWRARPDLMVRELFGVTPDAWQDDVLWHFPVSPRIAMKAAKGPGKELCSKTLIPVPGGLKLFGDLGVGDKVFAEDGSQTTVTGVFPQGIKPVWRVKFDDGSSVLAGAEHLWKVKGANERRKGQDWAVLTTAEIIERGVRVKNGRWAGRQFEIPIHGAAQYAPVPLPIDPYLLGVWIGDGRRSEPSYFKPYVEVEHEIQRRGYETSRQGGNVRILNAVSEFRRIACFSDYSYERYIPSQYKFSSPQQRRDLLCGLMDTDGCIGDDSHMEYATTSQRLADDIVWLARSLGGNAYQKKTIKHGWYNDDDGNRVDCRDCYRVTVRTAFNPFRIPHKAERWLDPLVSKSRSRYLTRYIDSIEPEGDADCMCIEVDHPSHCYLANDFIVTHNTTCLAWCCWNFLLTRPDPNIAAVSISADNLRDNLWKEMAYWHGKSKLLQMLFEWTAERIFSKEIVNGVAKKATWFMSARSWPKSANQQDIGNTLAGLHSDYIMFVIDESGSAPPAITASAEAALSSCKEGHIMQAGNTNMLEGALYDACVKHKQRWYVVDINGDPDNPKRSPRISLEWAKEMIATYGRDNPFVKVMVLGEWPSASVNALIGPDEVEASFKRQYQQHHIEHSPKILGVDVARQGDDASVIFPRQGLVAFPPHIMRGADSMAGAGQVNRIWTDWKADAVFIDDTGGYGAGWIDMLRMLKREPIGVGFAQAAREPKRYANRRAEIYFTAVQWIRDGGCLPNMPELVSELSQTCYSFRGDALLLEPKEIIKKKIGRSPDVSDSFCLTFAEPITPRGLAAEMMPRTRAVDNYDVFSEYYRF